MFNVLRQMERWLHQHIFKVGWLFTKDFQVTTILYYTFLLPGILLYELSYWLAAGILNVRAERAIRWPEKQEIGELRLNFVKLSKKANPLRVTVINIVPLIVGLLVLWGIAVGIFDLQRTLDHFDTHTTLLNAATAAIRDLVSVPDFWLWAWIAFAVSNTMLPDQNALKGRWWIFGLIVVGMLPLFFLQIGEQTVGDAITAPVSDGLNVISTAFGFTIFINLCAVAILGLIESATEYITGNSATFKNGKMVVMTREAAVTLRRQEQQKERSKLQQKRLQAPPTVPQGPPSIYRLSLPIPGDPGQEPITQSATSLLIPKASSGRSSKPSRPVREEPGTIISEAVKVEPMHDEIQSEPQPAQAESVDKDQEKVEDNADSL